MRNSYNVSDRIYESTATRFDDSTSTARSFPGCRCIHDFFLNLWDNKVPLVSSAVMGGLALTIYYTLPQPMATGICIGSAATLAMIGLRNSCYLRPSPPYLRDSNDSSYLINPGSNSSGRSNFERVEHGSPSVGSFRLSTTPTQAALEITPFGYPGIPNPFSQASETVQQN